MDSTASMSLDELRVQTQLIKSGTNSLEQEIRLLRSEMQEKQAAILQNRKSVLHNSALPHLVAHISEIFRTSELDHEAGDDDSEASANQRADTYCAVIKTTMRNTSFLPVIGLVEAKNLRPGDLVGVNKDSHLVLSKLPPEYDTRVVSMELTEPPDEKFTDIGGLDAQIQELQEAVVWPVERAELFKSVGIQPPRGVLLHGPPGTGKTMMARACAAATKSTFLRLAAPQLVQSFSGEGGGMVREMFEMARSKAPAIIFIDEIDAIGGKRVDTDEAADRQVHRIMLELLSQMDGFDQSDAVRVIAATNRPDTLDPALLRAGRFDRKIEFPLPNAKGRAQIIKLHSRKMNVSGDVSFEELAAATEDFNGAQLRAVAVEAGMCALRASRREITHNDFVDAIAEVLNKQNKEVSDFYT